MKKLALFLSMVGLAACLRAAAADDDLPQVPAADAKALAKLTEMKATTLRLAANTNLLSVDFSLSQAKVGDAGLESLKPIAEQVYALNLAGTDVTDAGLAHIAGLKNLRKLHLEKTGITDKGLAALKDLGELRYLNLYGTKVGDAGLAHLKNLKKLKSLYLWQTAVTAPAADDLGKTVQGLYVNRGGELVPVVFAAKAINAKCPVSGKDVDPAHTVTFKGNVIGFCCPNCPGQFEKEPAKFIGKVKEFKEKPEAVAGGKAINAKCPVSGKDVDAAHTLAYKGQTIGFCCPNCPGKFEKEPAKFIGKVKEFKEPPAAAPAAKPADPKPAPAGPKPAAEAKPGDTIDDEGFIKHWLILGPIANAEDGNGAAEVDKQQVANEAALKPKVGDKAKVGDKELTWKEFKTPEFFVDFKELVGQDQGENVVGYAVCYVNSDTERKGLKMKIGTNDEGKVYLNGKEIFKTEAPSSLEKDAHTVENLTLNKGQNVIVCKIINEGNNWQSCVRFTDDKDAPVKNLKISVAP